MYQLYIILYNNCVFVKSKMANEAYAENDSAYVDKRSLFFQEASLIIFLFHI